VDVAYVTSIRSPAGDRPVLAERPLAQRLSELFTPRCGTESSSDATLLELLNHCADVLTRGFDATPSLLVTLTAPLNHGAEGCTRSTRSRVTLPPSLRSA
jgi:hypothetical protein